MSLGAWQSNVKPAPKRGVKSSVVTISSWGEGTAKTIRIEGPHRSADVTERNGGLSIVTNEPAARATIRNGSDWSLSRVLVWLAEDKPRKVEIDDSIAGG